MKEGNAMLHGSSSLSIIIFYSSVNPECPPHALSSMIIHSSPTLALLGCVCGNQTGIQKVLGMKWGMAGTEKEETETTRRGS